MPSSLSKKLRVPAGRLLFLNAPAGHVEALSDLPDGAQVSTTPYGTFDFVHLFVHDSAAFAGLGPVAAGAVTYDGLLWVCYPKGGSKVKTDLNRDILWRLVEGLGPRPVAQVSVDELWSAMRLPPPERVKRRDGDAPLARRGSRASGVPVRQAQRSAGPVRCCLSRTAMVEWF
jgi:hypothetical protein